MSVLGRQTNITPNDYFFLRANVSTLTADSIVAKNISTLTGQIGSLTTTDLSANFLVAGTISTNSLKVNNVDGAGRIESYEFSSVYTYADIGTVSTLLTQHIVLDQATLDVFNGTELLLNGVPIATTANLSSIQDWAIYPAASTISMLGNNILNAGNITSQNIYNALAIQTDTLSALTSLTAPSGTLTNARTTNLSTTNLVASNAKIPTLTGVDGINNSTIVMNSFVNMAGNGAAPTLQLKYSNMLTASNFGNITTDGSGGLILTDWYNNSQANTILDVRRNPTNTGYNSVANFSTLNSGNVSTGSLTVAGQPYVAGSNWAQYPASANVNLNGYDINSGNNATLTINALSNLNELSQGYSNVVDKGIDVLNAANIFLNAKNGRGGQITLQADPGYAGIFGQIDITANGGTTGPVGTGGLINITANTPSGFSNATSAIKINAAGVNSYAGAIPPIGSIAGYNFLYGMVGVNICAGLPPLFPNTPLTTYLYGTAGVVSGSDFYTPNIYPYWNGLTTPPDMLISGRYIAVNFAQVYVNLSNVKNIYMDSIGYIHNAKTIDMIDGTITQASNISGAGSISGYASISGTNGSFTTLSNTNLVGTGTGSISAYSNISTSNLNTAFINSIPIADYLGGGGSSTISTFATATIGSLNVSSIQKAASFLEINTPTLDFSYPGGTTFNNVQSIFGTAGSNIQINSATVSINAQSGGFVKVGTTSAGDVDTFFLPNATVSTQSIFVSSINDFASFGTKSMRVQGDVAQIQLSNNNVGGSGTILNLLSRPTFSEIQSFDSNFTTPLPLVLTCSEVSTAALVVSTINGIPYPADPIFGEFQTTSTITVSAGNTPTVIPLDTLLVGNGVILNSGDVRFLTSGLYEYSFNVQLDKTGGGIDTCDVWLRLNGVDITNTASRFSIQGTQGLCLAVCSFFLSVNAGDSVSIVFASPDASMSATFFPAWSVAGGDPYDRPSVPANIVQITKIR